MIRLFAAVLFALLLSACGDDPQAPAPAGGGEARPDSGKPAATAHDDTSSGKAAADDTAPKKAAPDTAAPDTPDRSGSAFQLVATPEKVKHSLDMALFRKGVRRPDPRDAIPAILEPKFVAAKDVTFMRPERRVIQVRVGEEVRAYPLHILDRHELVNDTLGGKAVLITWCPLCGSSVVYDRVVAGKTLTFGVSGYLYKSDVLMYDHQTESFWSQLELGAVAGPQTGTELTVLPSQVTSFGAFKKAHPDASVLSDDQGIVPPREYVRQPYMGYDKMPNIWFPVGKQSKALHPKAEVIGVLVNGKARAYALTAVRTTGAVWDDTVGGDPVQLRYAREGDTVTVLVKGKLVPHQRMFWFAWFAFHPDTDLRATATGPVVDEPGDIKAAPK